MSPVTMSYRAAALAAYFALLVLMLNWFTWLAPPERMPIAIALILTAVPLLFPLRGLLHGRLYTHAWTSFLALPYFILGVDAVAAGTEPIWLGWATVVASTTLFTATVGYTRCRGRELRADGG
ncbi:DUF2069 domain-containing protein [Halofilum ochraceum]|uniref:DUF2069 domain-containing protein n=1 Tax=Halofilum ochraceum TaxID=1611323 RepID=UPI001FE0451E|nr:DUF2069 domain-containing protein [Halofilum ochraceum]